MVDEILGAEYEGKNVDKIERLVELNLLLVRAQRQKELNNLYNRSNKETEQEIKYLKQQIALQRDLVKVGDKILGNLDEEVSEKKQAVKTFKDYTNAIKNSNSSLSTMKKSFAELKKSAESAGYSFKDIRGSATFGSIFKQWKSFDFRGAAEARIRAGGWEGVAKNTLPALEALGSKATLAAAGLYGVYKGFKIFYDNILVPSARMRNIAGQQLGLAAGSRNLYGGHWIKEWAGRTLLGYSAEEQQGLYSSLVDALRRNPNEPGATAVYQNTLMGMMANQRLFGTSTGSMSKIYKAFDQTGVSSKGLSEKFYELMRGVEGTGWTTSEYADILSKNVMYLKNFGVNLDTYSKNLLRYGEAIRQEQITAADISPKARGESTGEMAFVAQKLLQSGLISEKTLGAGLGSSVVKQAGSLRAYARSHPVEYFQKIFRLYQTNPELSSFLRNATGGDNSPAAIMEALTQLGAPGTAALSELSSSQGSPGVWMDIVQGKFGSKTSTGLGDKLGEGQIITDAMKNLAMQTTGFKMLLLNIAKMIKSFGEGLTEDIPQDFSTGGNR